MLTVGYAYCPLSALVHLRTVRVPRLVSAVPAGHVEVHASRSARSPTPRSRTRVHAAFQRHTPRRPSRPAPREIPPGRVGHPLRLRTLRIRRPARRRAGRERRHTRPGGGPRLRARAAAPRKYARGSAASLRSLRSNRPLTLLGCYGCYDVQARLLQRPRLAREEYGPGLALAPWPVTASEPTAPAHPKSRPRRPCASCADADADADSDGSGRSSGRRQELVRMTSFPVARVIAT